MHCFTFYLFYEAMKIQHKSQTNKRLAISDFYWCKSSFILPQKSLNLSSVLEFNNLCKFYALTGYDLPTCWFLRFA